MCSRPARHHVKGLKNHVIVIKFLAKLSPLRYERGPE